MLLGVVSDTHGHVAFTLEAVRMLESLQVDQVLHCGDIGSPAIVPLFAAWPTDFVFGNVDLGYETPLRDAIRQAGQSCHERFGALHLAGTRIALLHSDDATRFEAACSNGEWDLVCYGHTHIAEQHRVGETLVLNPGALYRASRHTLAVVELPALNVTIVPVS